MPASTVSTAWEYLKRNAPAPTASRGAWFWLDAGLEVHWCGPNTATAFGWVGPYVSRDSALDAAREAFHRAGHP